MTSQLHELTDQLEGTFKPQPVKKGCQPNRSNVKKHLNYFENKPVDTKGDSALGQVYPESDEAHGKLINTGKCNFYEEKKTRN